MGLAVVHGVVHEYVGHLCVESTPGEGTHFRVLFPPISQEDRRVPDTQSTESGQAPAPGRQQGRVLLVDDDDLAGGLMLDLLEDRGLDVVLVMNGEEAIAALSTASAPFDLLITDQAMPRMTGLELVRRVRPIHPDLPIIPYTGNANALDAKEIEAAGVRALVRKPVDVAALGELLRDLLN
jgi:CheY-like chemotaxis protein